MQSVDIDVWGADGRTVGITVRHPNPAITLQADRATRRAYREALRAGRPIESPVRRPVKSSPCAGRL